MQGGASLWYSQSPDPLVGNPQRENNYNCRISPQETRVLSPTSGSPVWYSCTGKTSPQNVWLWRPLSREGNGTPLQYSCLENPRDGGAWWASVYGIAQSRTRLKRLSSRVYFQVAQRIVGSRGSILKGHTKISHTLWPRSEAVIWKELELDTAADLGQPHREAGGNCNSPWRQTLVAAILGNSYSQMDTGAGKHHIGISL